MHMMRIPPTVVPPTSFARVLRVLRILRDLRDLRDLQDLRVLAILAVSLVPALAAREAHAGRALEEPAGIAKIVKRSSAVDLDKALTAAAASERCAGMLKAPVSADPRALECRAVAAVHVVRAKPIASKGDVDSRRALLDDVVAAAAQVSTWAPLSPPPGLARARYEAHRGLSAAGILLYNDLVLAADAGTAGAADVVKATPPIKDAVCTALQRSLELGVGADASLEERGAVQARITSHKCFLDESRLKVEPKPGLALKDSADARSVAASTSSSGAILAYAQTRNLDLERCEKHLDAGGRPKDKAKLEQCACGAIARWKLPSSPHKDAVTAKVPVAGSAHVDLEVTPAGAVTKCALAAP
jgi:hypothetical protein